MYSSTRLYCAGRCRPVRARGVRRTPLFHIYRDCPHSQFCKISHARRLPSHGGGRGGRRGQGRALFWRQRPPFKECKRESWYDTRRVTPPHSCRFVPGPARDQSRYARCAHAHGSSRAHAHGRMGASAHDGPCDVLREGVVRPLLPHLTVLQQACEKSSC